MLANLPTDIDEFVRPQLPRRRAQHPNRQPGHDQVGGASAHMRDAADPGEGSGLRVQGSGFRVQV